MVKMLYITVFSMFSPVSMLVVWLLRQQDNKKTTEQISCETWMEEGSRPRMQPFNFLV